MTLSQSFRLWVDAINNGDAHETTVAFARFIKQFKNMDNFSKLQLQLIKEEKVTGTLALNDKLIDGINRIYVISKAVWGK